MLPWIYDGQFLRGHGGLTSGHFVEGLVKSSSHYKQAQLRFKLGEHAASSTTVRKF